jgi:NADPH2:quinone reductase
MTVLKDEEEGTMKAVWYDRTGPAREVLQYGELPTPSAGVGQVLIRTRASGVNPSDAGMRRGGTGPMTYPRIIPNSDGAGVVEAVGPGVSQRWVGKRAWFYNGQRNGRAFGSAAEFIALDVDLVRELPDHVSFAEGATLGIPCMTAHVALFKAGPVQGRTVLVTGGAGAVGHYAVQLAKWAGATVIATVSSQDKAERALAGGADHATRGEAAPQIPAGALMRLNLSVHGVYLPVSPHEQRRRAQDDITRWIGTGLRTLSVAGTFPLEDTAGAHEMVEAGGKVGTVVVEVG